MRIRSNNKYISRFLGWVFNIQPLRVEFIFIQELYDNDVTELAFLNNTSALFEEQVEKFRKQLNEERERASQE
jgi:hypothetical protein